MVDELTSGQPDAVANRFIGQRDGLEETSIRSCLSTRIDIADHDVNKLTDSDSHHGKVKEIVNR